MQNETVGKDTATLVIHARILRWLELVPESTTLDTNSNIRDTRKRGVLYIHVQESRTTIENECNSPLEVLLDMSRASHTTQRDL